MKQIVLVETTFSEFEEAKKLAQQVVDLKLGACCQIIPKVTSLYLWQSKMEESQEAILRVKTLEENETKLIDFLRTHHTYAVPEIISYRVSCLSDSYYVWMKECLR
jgi:periplasmic divalent cation tolerance protein